MENFTNLLEFCETDRQRDVLEALIKHRTHRAAGKALGCCKSNVSAVLNTVTRLAEKRLYSPKHGLTHPVPSNFTGDFTIQRNAEGEIERSWMKGKADRDKLHEAYLSFIEGLRQEIVPAKPSKAITQASKDLASAIIFGDAHLGMLAHAVETLGEDYDLEKGTADIRMAIDYCVECAPASEEGWLINVGDFTHANDTKNMTPESGAILDVSARQNQTLRAAGAVLRYCVTKMLTKFNKVRVINVRGNHDKDAAFGLNMYMEAVYENEPRVQVYGNDAKFHFIEFGNCLIGLNHGDRINADRLAGVMTRTQAAAWGRTTYRRWWMGHIHHKIAQEHGTGVTIESFHTLAPLDYWHSASGYGAERKVTMITLHREFGEVNRMSPSLELVRAQRYNLQRAA